MSAACSAYTPLGGMSPGSPTSPSTRSSIAARSPPDRDVRRRSHHDAARHRPRLAGLRRRKLQGARRGTWRSATSATRPPVAARGRTANRSGVTTAARSPSPTTATSPTRSRSTTSCGARGSFRGTSTRRSSPPSSRPRRPRADRERGRTAVMPRLEGAYSTVVMTKRAVVAFRDPYGAARSPSAS